MTVVTVTSYRRPRNTFVVTDQHGEALHSDLPSSISALSLEGGGVSGRPGTDPYVTIERMDASAPSLRSSTFRQPRHFAGIAQLGRCVHVPRKPHSFLITNHNCPS